MRLDGLAKTDCVCANPIKVHEPDGLGPRCVLCGLSLGERVDHDPTSNGLFDLAVAVRREEAKRKGSIRWGNGRAET